MKLENYLKVEIACADIPHMLRAFYQQNVILTSVETVDVFTIRCCIKPKDLCLTKKIAEKCGSELKVLSKGGLACLLHNMLRRPVLIASLLIILMLSVLLPRYVLFVEVDGAVSVPGEYIVEKAAKCGIRFGASRKSVRSEQMKNKLLTEIPQLQWAGINTYGSVAVISVEEKSVPEEQEDNNGKVSSIIAAHDGIVTACTVQKGTQVCQVGQAVQEGELLVSGYTDCGLKVQATQAEAEISAKTLRHLEAIMPAEREVRGETAKKTLKISLQIGKKLINLLKGSGICGTSCVKMYKQKYITLPGGRTLPISIIFEQCVSYQESMKLLPDLNAETEIESMAQDYLISQMIAGEITHVIMKKHFFDGYWLLNGTYSCQESIERVIYEGRIDNYG